MRGHCSGLKYRSHNRVYAPPANDEEDIIDTHDCDNLSTGGIITTIQLTYNGDMFEICLRKAPNNRKCN